MRRSTLYLFVFVITCLLLQGGGSGNHKIVGIDISHHNGKIDWTKVKRKCPDLEFVYIKCTEGATFVDSKFKTNAEGALAQGYNVGAYHYFRMTSGAREQFQHFKENTEGVGLNLIPMVDVEKTDGKTKAELQDSLQVMLNLLEEEYGTKPMIYGINASYNKLCAPRFNSYPLYIGLYGDEEPDITGPGHYVIWQYSMTGIIKGIPKDVDLCRFHPGCGIDDIRLQ